MALARSESCRLPGGRARHGPHRYRHTAASPCREIKMRVLYLAVLLLICAALGACAGMSGRDPVQVTVAGIEPLPGEGLEARLLIKLRIQNPNDAPIDYDGVFVELDVLDKTYATG